MGGLNCVLRGTQHLEMKLKSVLRREGALSLRRQLHLRKKRMEGRKEKEMNATERKAAVSL